MQSWLTAAPHRQQRPLDLRSMPCRLMQGAMQADIARVRSQQRPASAPIDVLVGITEDAFAWWVASHGHQSNVVQSLSLGNIGLGTLGNVWM